MALNNKRNRSEGWKYAKIDGHNFEKAFAVEVMKGKDLYQKLKNISGIDSISQPVDTLISHDKKKPTSIFGDQTTSKTDVTVFSNFGDPLDISIKKPSTTSGQVLLCKLGRFLKLIEIKSGNKTPPNVLWALKAFLGETNRLPITEFAPQAKLRGPHIKKHRMKAEIYQNRLYASTLKESYPAEWVEVQNWFKNNMAEITDCCFRSGMCADNLDERSTAEYIYVGCLNTFFKVKDLSCASLNYEIHPSIRGNYKGSTIQLPWGFLQGHRPGKHEGPYQVQFHWSAKDILKLLTK